MGYNPVDPLRVNVGFHYFYDKQASAYNHREEKLKRGTMEWTAGAEFDASKRITVSAGWQNTNYGLSEAYMNDKSFVVSSNSVACGARYHVTKRMDINVAYFHTFYQHKKNTDDVALSSTQWCGLQLLKENFIFDTTSSGLTLGPRRNRFAKPYNLSGSAVAVGGL